MLKTQNRVGQGNAGEREKEGHTGEGIGSKRERVGQGEKQIDDRETGKRRQ